MYPDNIIIPTLDIDIIWHTHLLNPYNYHIYYSYYTNRFANHNDTITPYELDTYLLQTKQLWIAHFQEEYMSNNKQTPKSKKNMMQTKNNTSQFWFCNVRSAASCVIISFIFDAVNKMVC